MRIAERHDHVVAVRLTERGGVGRREIDLADLVEDFGQSLEPRRHFLGQAIAIVGLALYARVPVRHRQLAVVTHGRRQHLGVPAAARPDLQHCHACIETEELEGLDRVSVLVTGNVGLGTVLAGSGLGQSLGQVAARG